MHRFYLSPAAAAIAVALLVLAAGPDAAVSKLSLSRYKSTCETLPSDIHITKGTRIYTVQEGGYKAAAKYIRTSVF